MDVRQTGTYPCRALEFQTAAFTDEILIPTRDFYYDVALNNGLTAQAGMEGQSGSHVEPIGFVFIHFRKIVVAFFDDDVASCTGTAAAAGMIKMNAEVHADIEDRFGFAMLSIRHVS